MGLGLHIGAELKPSKFLRRTPDVNQLFSNIRKEITSYVEKKDLAILLDQNVDNNVLYVTLYPAEEAVQFFAKDDYLTCSAKSSSAGPGYHAFLVDLLETIGGNLNLHWEWDNEAKDFCDETGYRGSKSFKELKLQMSEYLKAIANHLLKENDLSNIGLSLPMHFTLENPYFAASPMGFWDREFFEQILESDSIGILDFGARFFPWWNESIDAEFWQNAALVQMWTDIKWHPPSTDEERRTLSCVCECISKAKKFDSDIQIPHAEFEEIESLLRSNNDYPIPPKDRIGFYRYNMRRPTAGHWSIVIPGYYYFNWEDDNTTAVYWYGTRAIYGSSLAFEPKNKLPDLSISDTALNVFKFEKDDLRGVAELTKTQEGENNTWTLQCRVVAPGSLSILSVVFEKEDDLDWAKAVFESARYAMQSE